MNTVIWCSGATNVTAGKIGEALNLKVVRTKPGKNSKIICWGTKTNKPVELDKKQVLNHPNNIRVNRNKKLAMEKMQDTCNISSFVSVKEVTKGLAEGKVAFPMVARRNFHQGGKDFWLCLNKNHIDIAKVEGAQYFQNFIDIQDEYRFHIFQDKVIHVVKKVTRKNLKKAYIQKHLDKALNWAEKNEVNLDENTATIVLDIMSKMYAQHSDHIVRSNLRGWKFVEVPVDEVNEDLKNQALAATKALGLDFGAVDCCINNEGVPYIIEVNSGPGLDGKVLAKWVACFKDWIEEQEKPVKPVPKKKPKKQVVVQKVGKKVVGAKKQIQAKLVLLNELLDVADDNEVEALEKLINKILV